MFITFLGNPRDPSDHRSSVTIAETDFPLNVEVEVMPSPMFAKLRSNDHFSVRDVAAVSEEAVAKPTRRRKSAGGA